MKGFVVNHIFLWKGAIGLIFKFSYLPLDTLGFPVQPKGDVMQRENLGTIPAPLFRKSCNFCTLLKPLGMVQEHGTNGTLPHIKF